MPKPAKHARENESGGTQFANQARAWAVGLNFVYGVVGFAAIGWALEKWVWPRSAPWLLMTGLFVGLLGSGYRFIREAMAMGKKK